MKLFGCIAVFSCVILLCSGQNETTTTPDTSSPVTDLTTTTTPSSTTSTSAPTTTPSTTTTTSTTTTAESTITTTPNTITTPATELTSNATVPVTTTTPQNSSEPVTTASTGSQPTEAPTTVSPATTTAAPTADDGHYNVTGNNVVCILAQMKINLNLAYVTTESKNATKSYGVNGATVDPSLSSDCNSTAAEQKMTLVFNNDNIIALTFGTDGDKSFVDKVVVNITDVQKLFDDAAPKQNLNLHFDGRLFELNGKTKSFRCNSEEKASLTDLKNGTGSEVSFQNVQVQAFRTSNDDKFGDAVVCSEDDNVSNVVPIAVGCALAGLVVIVLIAYLVGRRQKRQRGYESV